MLILALYCYKMELQGNGFTIREWRLTDAASLQRNADNPNVSRFLLDRFPSPYTPADAEFWVALCQEQEPPVNFAIDIKGEVVGGIALDLRQDVYRKTPHIGYWLAEQYWGKGIMPQAVKLMTAYAFRSLDVICVMAYVFGKNTASMRVLKKAGYIKIGIIPRSIIKDDEIMDEHIYAINKPR